MNSTDELHGLSEQEQRLLSRHDTPFRRSVRRFVRHRMAVVGAVVLLALSLAAIAAALDEAMGRAIMIPYGETIWGVTGELHFRILRPAPIGVELIGTGRIISEKSRIFEGSGELLFPMGRSPLRGMAATSSSTWSRSAASIPCARSGASGPIDL